ncbi:MAG: nucleotidyltransferase family protein [Verrucomicrobia bacterium]|nr:nucleotidyltransferase family protein [Verrucomicrobiota bacterium]
MFFLCPLRGASSGSGSIQRAVILAAGKGTRMGELTVDVPKPMLSVCGTPIVEHILSGLTSAGIREIYIVIGWRGEAIRDYCGSGEKWGISISYGNQGVQNGTGKAAEVARQFAGDSDFLLTYGDILVPPEAYQQTIRRFSETTSSGLLTVTYGEDVTKGLSVLLDKDFYVEELIERPSDSQMKQLLAAGQLKPYGSVWRDAGIYIFRSSLFDFTCRLECSPRGEYELTDAVKKMLISGRRLMGLEIGNRWVDVRNPEVLASLQRPSSFVD